MQTVNLATHPVVQTEYGRWQPLNTPLGVTAFGISAMVCDPGEDFDIAHDEAESGQEEAYVVVSGRAEFTVGDRTLEVPAGGLLAVTDPSTRRSYRALEPGTRIVCVGGRPTGEPVDYGEWIRAAG